MSGEPGPAEDFVGRKRAARVGAGAVLGGLVVAFWIVVACIGPLAGTTGGYRYRSEVPADRPAGDFTVRLLPRRDGVAIPLEYSRILWQH